VARRPSDPQLRTAVTVGTIIQELLPRGANPAAAAPAGDEPDWEIMPLWPPDLFAVVATLAERSGFYTEPGIALSTSQDGRRRKRQRAEEAERLGERWARDPTGTPPAAVFTLWDRLRRAWDEPVASGPGIGGRWKQAAMRLLAIADEACAGVGFPPNANGALTIATFVYQEYLTAYKASRGGRSGTLPHLPHSLALAVPPSRACVMPKGLTPEVGCTLRSTSHNLALLPPLGQVAAEWRMVNWSSETPAPGNGGGADIAPFNLLVVPFPYVLDGNAFTCERKPDGPDVDGYFTLKATWLGTDAPKDQAQSVANFISDLIDAAERDGGAVNAVILPETALPSQVAQWVADLLAHEHPHLEMFVSGVMAPPPPRPPGGERPFARNAAFVARFDRGRAVDRYQQAKHHRWRVDPNQVQRYRLSHVLEASRSWWEAIDLADRRMVFGLDARQAVVAALICEDLARYDPVLPVLASVGPNLVIALLMDGPQLRSRWPSRHAAVLADDPGSAVLTVTSLGMVRRSETPAGATPRDCVAMWTERGQNPRELDLDTGAHALFLSLAAHQKRQKTLDIRRQRDSGGLIEYRLAGCRNVKLPDGHPHGWLFNAPSAAHIAGVEGSDRQ
jgi:hypothetical protein